MSRPKSFTFHLSIVRRTANSDTAERDQLLAQAQAEPDGKITWQFTTLEPLLKVQEWVRALPNEKYFWYLIRETHGQGEQPKFLTNHEELQATQARRMVKQPNVSWEYLLTRAEGTLERLEYRPPKPPAAKPVE